MIAGKQLSRLGLCHRKYLQNNVLSQPISHVKYLEVAEIMCSAVVTVTEVSI